MVQIMLKDGQDGYEAVGEYIRRYWRHHDRASVLISLSTSFDGKTYDYWNYCATPEFPWGNEIVYNYEWWKGERYIKILGIKDVNCFDVQGGVYED